MKLFKESLNREFGCFWNKKRMIPIREKESKSKLGQASVLIILAIVIVFGVVLFFVFRGSLSFSGPPSELEPVYTYYLGCIEQETKIAVGILGQQGGYIEGVDFVPGSEYMPFSNYLNFVGIPIPYWYYISGNNILREQVPSKDRIEEEMNNFLEGRIAFCDFSRFASEGFEIEIENEANVETRINDNNIDVKVEQNIAITRGDSSWSSSKHSVEVSSRLGKFYELAKKIYDDFKTSAFLENYGVDVLRLYAPVDGVEIQCSPAVWNVEEVRENVTRALEANVPFTKIKGDYYDLSRQENEYFIWDIGEKAEVPVNFLFDRNWPSKMEVWPNDQGLLISDPIGNQEGLGLLGFCYVPYHFVYDLAYPVLIQLHDGEDIFQFPVVVNIEKNRPREPILGSSFESEVSELCSYRNTRISVSTFNTNLEPLQANIEYRCFDEVCRIGSTSVAGGDSILIGEFPQCANGFVVASAEGYETKSEIFSTINSGSIDLFLNKEYELELEMPSIDGQAVITFKKEDGKTSTVSYPELDRVKLSAGQYEIKVYVYSDSNIRLVGSTEQKCVEVPTSGLGGVFGFTSEKCFDLEIPSQTVSTAIAGGGKQNYFVSESELEFSNKIVIAPINFGTPNKVEDLQINYNRVETEGLSISFE